eukprot:TRINITY_DN8776_c0_g3_i1.p1 TRINITY_DN8776_c0_g3~~TRINITY_DN8776_c0_g3_i1.p1  ORF type:complete len:336 (+),score=46.72 TRINITY_DN8776_c0_g3_i1:121-1128(+)
MLGEYMSKCLENVFGYLWPAYRTYKTLEEGQYDSTRQWCIYWGVFGTLSVCEQILDKFLFWVPLYHEFKVAFVVWLWHEKFKGAQYIYYCWVLPWLRQNEHIIDQKVDEFKQKVLQLIASHSARFSAYLKEGFCNIIILLHNMQDDVMAHKRRSYGARSRYNRYSTVRESQDGRLEYDDESDSRCNEDFDLSDDEQHNSEFDSDYEYDYNKNQDFVEEDDDDDEEQETAAKKVPPRKRIIEEFSIVRQVRSSSVYDKNSSQNVRNKNQPRQWQQSAEKQRSGFQQSSELQRQRNSQKNQQQQLQVQDLQRRNTFRRKGQGSSSGRNRQTRDPLFQ